MTEPTAGRSAGAVVAAGLWITISEFVRNELLFKSYWVDHFAALNLTFETKPLNGILWTVWSFLVAYLLLVLTSRLSFGRAMLLGWLAFFPTMWITLFNLQVLPLPLLTFAIPLGLIEVAVAILILRRIAPAS